MRFERVRFERVRSERVRWGRGMQQGMQQGAKVLSAGRDTAE